MVIQTYYINLENLEPLESNIVDNIRETYEKIPQIDDSLASTMANWPEGESMDWTSYISTVGTAYQTYKSLPVGERLHQGYNVRSRQSNDMLLEYTHALASNEKQTLIHLNSFLDLYRRSTPEILEEAVQVVRNVHTGLIRSKSVVMPQGSHETMEKANKILLQAQIVNYINND